MRLRSGVTSSFVSSTGDELEQMSLSLSGLLQPDSPQLPSSEQSTQNTTHHQNNLHSIYIYTNTHIHIYIQALTHRHTYTPMHARTHAHMNARIHALMHMNTHTQTHTHKQYLYYTIITIVKVTIRMHPYALLDSKLTSTQ